MRRRGFGYTSEDHGDTIAPQRMESARQRLSYAKKALAKGMCRTAVLAALETYYWLGHTAAHGESDTRKSAATVPPMDRSKMMDEAVAVVYGAMDCWCSRSERWD